MSSRTAVLVPVVTVLLTAGGCGGTSTPAAQPSDVPRTGLPSGAADPCRLATSAQVSAAVGTAVGPPLRSSRAAAGGTVLSCTWRAAAAQAQGSATLDVYPSTQAYEQARSTQAAQPAQTGFHELPGIGDQAFSGQLGVVWVRRGSVAYTAHWFYPQAAALVQVARSAALAKVVAGHL